MGKQRDGDRSELRRELRGIRRELRALAAGVATPHRVRFDRLVRHLTRSIGTSWPERARQILENLNRADAVDSAIADAFREMEMVLLERAALQENQNYFFKSWEAFKNLVCPACVIANRGASNSHVVERCPSHEFAAIMDFNARSEHNLNEQLLCRIDELKATIERLDKEWQAALESGGQAGDTRPQVAAQVQHAVAQYVGAERAQHQSELEAAIARYKADENILDAITSRMAARGPYQKAIYPEGGSVVTVEELVQRIFETLDEKDAEIAVLKGTLDAHRATS